MKYVIGLIDDIRDERLYIQRTIITNLPASVRRNEVGFVEYPVKEIGITAQNVINDITTSAISSLIVDYQLVTDTANAEGTDIYKEIRESIPKFPLIMLTNFPDACHENKDFVDADKVYSKGDFLKLESPYSKEKVSYIFMNMDKYVRARAEGEK